MINRRPARWTTFLTLLIAGICLLLALPPAAGSQDRSGTLQAAFGAAAAEFGVPPSVLLAVSYNLSRWEGHAGAPSTAGGYGPMHLTQLDPTLWPNWKGDGRDRRGRTMPSNASLHTLDRAAALLRVDPERLKHDPAHNIRGGAALLADHARQSLGRLPADAADWYGAVALYSGSQEAVVALDFADMVYATIQSGASRTTSDGQIVTLDARKVEPNTSTIANIPLRSTISTSSTADCPATVACEFIPAAYHFNDPADLSNYGNFDLANRPDDGLDIRYIVIHNTEVDYAGTLAIFQNPLSAVSTHYVLRSVDGHIAQMVENKNVAWHAGNWYVNGHSIGLEHEGFAIEGATWYTEPMYRASAQLVRYLARKYEIPIDRAHIIGHDDIPHPTNSQQVMHWDPGPFWDWEHYMDLIGAPIAPAASYRSSAIVTIGPRFETNIQTVLNCEGNQDTLTQAVSFVYLHTAPSFDAPLIGNPYIGSDPKCANNWANKAATGQQFVRVERQGEWDAIWFSGQKAWFFNPDTQPTAVAGGGLVVTPKAGRAAVPLYGRAYPEAGAYPATDMVQPVQPIDQYSLPAGQRYVAVGPFRSTYYWAREYAPSLEISEHQVISGATEYYQIFYNHRFAFVKAEDVDIQSEGTVWLLPLVPHK